MSKGTHDTEWDACAKCGRTLSREELEQNRCCGCEQTAQDCACDNKEA
mgnify:CR=1 FL=1